MSFLTQLNPNLNQIKVGLTTLSQQGCENKATKPKFSKKLKKKN